MALTRVSGNEGRGGAFIVDSLDEAGKVTRTHFVLIDDSGAREFHRVDCDCRTFWLDERAECSHITAAREVILSEAHQAGKPAPWEVAPSKGRKASKEARAAC